MLSIVNLGPDATLLIRLDCTVLEVLPRLNLEHKAEHNS
jgi:hypothetical protein